jgi:hypothetical protein
MIHPMRHARRIPPMLLLRLILSSRRGYSGTALRSPLLDSIVALAQSAVKGRNST